MNVERLIKSTGITPLTSIISDGNNLLPKNLPPIVTASVIDCAALELEGTKVLLAQLKKMSNAVTIARTIDCISGAAGCKVLAYFDELSKYMRTALIRELVPFATEDGQFFIPGAISLLPVTATPSTSAPRSLPPAAMRAFIWWLSKKDSAGTQEVAEALGVSKSTAARACESLAAAGVLSKRMIGTRKHTASYGLRDGSEGIQAGIQAFGDPVKEEYFVDLDKTKGLSLAGESALAQRSLLASPSVPIFAVSPKQGKALVANANEQIAFSNPAKVKVLKYNPNPMSIDGMVDSFTMTKTLDNPDDERVIISLHEALGEQKWFEFQE